MKKPRIFLADDHRMMMDALKQVLEEEFEIAGTANDGMALLAQAPTLVPDVVLLDISMPLLNGLDAAKELRKKLPQAKLVFLTMNDDPQLVAAAIRAGASGFLLKQSAISELPVCIHHVLRGERYVSPAIAERAMDLMVQNPRAASGEQVTLTPRQRQVLQLLAEGKPMKEIGQLLGISSRTVAEHKYNIMEMLGMKNNSDLVQYAIQHKLVRMRTI